MGKTIRTVAGLSALAGLFYLGTREPRPLRIIERSRRFLSYQMGIVRGIFLSAKLALRFRKAS
jgi:hypothetical protein